MTTPFPFAAPPAPPVDTLLFRDPPCGDYLRSAAFLLPTGSPPLSPDPRSLPATPPKRPSGGLAELPIPNSEAREAKAQPAAWGLAAGAATAAGRKHHTPRGTANEDGCGHFAGALELPRALDDVPASAQLPVSKTKVALHYTATYLCDGHGEPAPQGKPGTRTGAEVFVDNLAGVIPVTVHAMLLDAVARAEETFNELAAGASAAARQPEETQATGGTASQGPMTQPPTQQHTATQPLTQPMLPSETMGPACVPVVVDASEVLVLATPNAGSVRETEAETGADTERAATEPLAGETPAEQAQEPPDPFALPLSSEPRSQSPQPDPEPPSPLPAPDPRTPFSQLLHHQIISALSTLHARLTSILDLRFPSASAENGSTLLLTLLLPALPSSLPAYHTPPHPQPRPEIPGTLYAACIGDSSLLILPHPPHPPVLPLFRRILPDLDPCFHPCSYEDTVHAHPRLKEGQSPPGPARDVAQLDLMRARAGLPPRQPAPGKAQGWGAVYSPRSGWGLGMCCTLGNRNHAGVLVERTNVYAWRAGDVLGEGADVVLLSDGVKDVLTAAQVGGLARNPWEGLCALAGVGAGTSMDAGEVLDRVRMAVGGSWGGDRFDRKVAEVFTDALERLDGARPGPEDLARLLCAAAVARGSGDDVTCLAFRLLPRDLLPPAGAREAVGKENAEPNSQHSQASRASVRLGATAPPSPASEGVGEADPELVQAPAEPVPGEKRAAEGDAGEDGAKRRKVDDEEGEEVVATAPEGMDERAD